MSKKDRPNPLPCGCAVFGIQKIDPFTEKISYENMYVKHCDMHTNAAVKLERLRAVVEAAEMVETKLREEAECVGDNCGEGESFKDSLYTSSITLYSLADQLAAALELVKAEEK